MSGSWDRARRKVSRTKKLSRSSMRDVDSEMPVHWHVHRDLLASHVTWDSFQTEKRTHWRTRMAVSTTQTANGRKIGESHAEISRKSNVYEMYGEWITKKKKKNFFKGWEKQSENPRKRGKRAERSPLSKKGSQIKERTDKKSNRICYCLQQPENMVITFSSALLKKSLDVSE